MPAEAAERRVALVTGSTRGIGWACARALAAAGYAVVINGARDPALGQARADELSAGFGVPALAVQADAGDDAQVEACHRTIFRAFKRLDLLVNNAGILADARIGMIPAELIARALRVNVAGAIQHTQAAARLMLRRKQGAIVNVSSILGLHGAAGAAVYATTKAALIGLTLSAAKELGPQGVRVNAVAPGLIETDLLRDLDPKLRDERLSGVPLGRIGTVDEVARAVCFLAEAGYVHGQVLGVDGGLAGRC